MEAPQTIQELMARLAERFMHAVRSSGHGDQLISLHRLQARGDLYEITLAGCPSLRVLCTREQIVTALRPLLLLN